MLRPVQDHPASQSPDLLVGFGTADDAGVFALGDGRALVQTVDIFAPVVDSAYDWGRIAAANALSDVYAMGGTPMTALQYIAWPRQDLPFDIAGEVITGGMDVMALAGCTVVGGHSIDGPEPHYGFAVTGLVDVDSVMANSGAAPGDALVLTKPLGTGIISTAIKRQLCPPSLIRVAVEVMTELNGPAASTAVSRGATAMTDVTGFGLLGHLMEMTDASGVGAQLVYSAVPVLDGVHELLAEGMWAGGSGRNLEAIEPNVRSAVDRSRLMILADAQTSGGLLIAIPRRRLGALLADIPSAAVIGEVTPGPEISVVPG